jgi:hypothetical protein
VRRRGSAALLLFAGLIAGCTPTQDGPAPAVRPDLPPSPAAPVAVAPVGVARDAAMSPEPQLDPDEAKSWTEPDVVLALARDCRWMPPAEDASGDAPGRASPLSCTLEFEQSCVPDPCFDEDQRTCKPACLRGCNDCADACGSRCETCKRDCRDEACRRSCASTCGWCHATCLKDKDRCTSGTCGDAYATCRKRLLAEWKRSACPAVCPRVRACLDKCYKGPEPATCTERCQAQMGACPERYYSVCVMGGEPTAD